VTTLPELVRSLPNGLHDAELRSYEMDVSHSRLVMRLDVWVDDVDHRPGCERYRAAKLILNGIRYFGIDPPGPGAGWLEHASIRTDVGFDPPPKATSCPPEPPPGSFRAWFWLDEINSFMHVVAETATLEWLGEEQRRDGC
jgi:hypothetical protein